jgi:hypothetical protein
MIAAAGSPLKRITEACVRVLDAWDSTCKHDPACDDDEHEREHFDETDDIHAADSPFGEEGMQSRDEADDSNGDSSFLPIRGSAAGGDKSVLCKDDASVGCIKVSVWTKSTSGLLCCTLTREAKENGLESKHGRCEEFRTLIGSLKVDLLPS